MQTDFILNGGAFGNLASFMLANGFDTRLLQPYVGDDGQTYVNRGPIDNQVATPVQNALATLRKDEWIELEAAVLKAARPRLRFVADLRGAGLEYNIGNGMAKTVLQYQDQSDGGNAVISMDGLRRGPGDRPVYDLINLPLPIVHSDFSFSARQIAASRNGNTPLDTTMGEQAATRVAEEIEKLALGEVATYTYGGGTIYGATNFPDRLTKSLTAPSSTNHAVTVKEVLEMRQQSIDAYHYGPWMLYHSPAWSEFLDEDYSTAKGDNTLRDRLRKIDGIQDVRSLDFLSDTTLLLVQMTSTVVRMVVGMEITTVQWESQGGMEQNFKVMGILVPQFRSDQNDRTGIVHGSV